MHIGQTVIAAAVAVGKAFVVQSQKVQHRRVQVMDVDAVFDGVPAEFIGRAVDLAAASAPSRSRPAFNWPCRASRALAAWVRPGVSPTSTSSAFRAMWSKGA